MNSDNPDAGSASPNPSEVQLKRDLLQSVVFCDGKMVDRLKVSSAVWGSSLIKHPAERGVVNTSYLADVMFRMGTNIQWAEGQMGPTVVLLTELLMFQLNISLDIFYNIVTMATQYFPFSIFILPILPRDEMAFDLQIYLKKRTQKLLK